VSYRFLHPLLYLFVAALFGSLAAPPLTAAPPAALSTPTAATRQAAPAPAFGAPNFGRLPLSFVPNTGQADPEARFLAHGMGGVLSFAPGAVRLVLPQPAQSPVALNPAQPWSAHVREARERAVRAPSPPTIGHQRVDGANPNPPLTTARR
jgi:hypothetical protein